MILLLLVILFIPLPLYASVTLLYFNDAHEIHPVRDRFGERGGLARLKTCIDSVKTEHPDALVIFGGDCAGGTLFGALYQGKPIVHAMNVIPVDMATFGQHDFDYGLENTRELVESSTFEWFTTNLDSGDYSLFNLPKYLIKRINRYKLGFLGLTDAMSTTSRVPVDQGNLISAAKLVLPELKFCDVIVALTQTTPEMNQNLLNSCPEIDLILTEERGENRSVIDHIGTKAIVYPSGNAGHIVQVNINKDKNTPEFIFKIIPVDNRVPANPGLSDFARQFAVSSDSSETVTVLYTDIPRKPSCSAETVLGNLISDSYRYFFNTDFEVSPTPVTL